MVVVHCGKNFLLALCVFFFLLFSCQNLNDDYSPQKQAQSRAVGDEETKPIVLGYFPSWKQGVPASDDENGIKGTRLGQVVGKKITHVFLAFARPNLRYLRNSYDLSQTGIEGRYTAAGSAKRSGEGLKEHIAYLKENGVQVLLSIGGETYWGSADAYDINYQQIADFVIDLGFSGIDWDFEPNGSFAQIGTQENINRFISFIKETREALAARRDDLPEGFNVDEFLIAVAPSAVGALGRPGNDDPRSPFRYANASQILKRYNSSWGVLSNEYKGTSVEDPIGLYGWSSAGHMVDVLKEVGNEIDIVAYQGYNIGRANQPKVVYDAWKFFADLYGFTIAAGVHVPNEPWGPYYTYTEQKVLDLAQYIHQGGFEGEAQTAPRRPNTAGARGRYTDGVMVWELEYVSALDSSKNGYSYMDIASKALNGENVQLDSGNSGEGNSGEGSPEGGNTSSGGESAEETSSNSGTDSGVALYAAGQAYYKGDRVVFEGKFFEALWWTKDQPSEVFSWSNPWKLLETNDITEDLRTEVVEEVKEKTGRDVSVSEETVSLDSSITPWSATTVYKKPGNLVSYDGAIWKNKWWAEKDPPGSKEWGAWEKVDGISADSDAGGGSGAGAGGSGAGAGGSGAGGGSDAEADNSDTGADDSINALPTRTGGDTSLEAAPWNAEKAYEIAGYLVSYKGSVWKNKWWSQKDEPGAATPNPNPWERVGDAASAGEESSESGESSGGQNQGEEGSDSGNDPPDTVTTETTTAVGNSSRPADKVVGGYFVEWGVYGRGYEVEHIPANKLTHIIYGFLAICGDNEQGMQDNPEGKRGLDKACQGKEDDLVVIHDPWAALQRSTSAASSWIPDNVILAAADSGQSTSGDSLAGISRGKYRGNYAALFDLKKDNSHLVILPSIGGWTLSDPFYAIAGDAQRRAKFIGSLEEYFKKYAFWGGVDIDWEYPGGGGASSYGSSADAENYVSLMRDLRAMLDRIEDYWGYDRGYLQLTSAVGQTTQKINNVNFKDASDYMNYIFVMSYDYYGGWASTLGHHANLNDYSYSKYAGYATTFPVQALIAQNVPKEKIVIGVAMYGRSWQGVSSSGSGDSWPFDGTGGVPLSKTAGMWEAGVNDYKQIVRDYLGSSGTGKDGFTYYYDTDAEAPYLWNPAKGQFITYDDQRSTLAKGKYVLDNSLGGLFAWELDADTTGNDSIINAMLKGLTE